MSPWKLDPFKSDQTICFKQIVGRQKDQTNKWNFEELVEIYFHTCRGYKVAKKNSDFQIFFLADLFLGNLAAFASVKLDVNKFSKLYLIR